MAETNDITKGVAIGVGLALLVPVALSALAPTLKPAARIALKTGIRAMEKGREMLAETTEMVEDIVAETEQELRNERMAAATDEIVEDITEAASDAGPEEARSA